MNEANNIRRYRAFLSYRHADNAQEGRRWAEWLHRGLERYIVPPDLVGTLNQRDAPIPDSLYPIFRDEDELPVDADLAAGIRRALEQSDCLIVICSPRSARSPWVAQEIREFKELGKSDRILAVMIAGEPNADDPAKASGGIFPEEECFPRELRYGVAVSCENNAAGHPRIDWNARTEPLAADLRPHKHRAEGFTSAAAYRENLKLQSSLEPVKIEQLAHDYGSQLEHSLLKIIAGVLAIPFGQLEDRDARHRAKIAEEEARRQKEIADREKFLAEQAIKAAEQARRAEEQARNAAERLRRRNRVLAVAVLVVLALSVAALAMWKRAEAASEEVRQTLSNTYFSKAVSLIAEGNGSDALAYLNGSLSLNPTNDAAAFRIVTLLSYHAWWIPTHVLRHGDSVTSAHFNADGVWIVTACDDGTARVWDAQTGLPQADPLKQEEPGRVSSARFSPDGKRVVTATDSRRTARVWDARTGQPLTDSMREAEFAEFSPDGKRVVLASGLGGSRVRDAKSGQPLTETFGGGDSAKFSPDGTRIVTASGNGHTAQVWDAQTGQPLTEPLKHGGFLESAKFSPDGQRIVTGSWDETARVWNAQTGQPLTQPLKHGGVVSSVAFSPDGKQVVTASGDGRARVWDAQSGQPLTNPLKHNGFVSSAEFSPDGKRIVTASRDCTARVWDSRSGHPLTEPLKHDSIVNSAEFSPDGRWIVTASQNNNARVWDALSAQPLHETLQHRAQVDSAQFSPDGKRIVTASADHTARVWDAESGWPLTRPLVHGSLVQSARFSPDGQRIVTVSGDHTARVWDAQTGQALTEPLKHDGEVHSARFSPDGKHILTTPENAPNGIPRVWDAQSGQPLKAPSRFPSNAWVYSADFSTDGKRVVTAVDVSGQKASVVQVWDAQTGQPVTVPLQHSNWVQVAKFSPDGKWILTLSGIRWSRIEAARLWNVQSGQSLTLALKHAGEVMSAEFSPDGERIVTASADQTARVWDAKTGQPLTEPMKHLSRVNAAQFSPNGKWVVTAEDAGLARVWDAHSGQPLTEPLTHEEVIWTAQFSPDGKRIVTASGDMTAVVWDLVPTQSPCPEWLLDLSKAVSGQALNKQGLMEPVTDHRPEMLNQIRQKLSQGSDNDDWVVWGRWFLAEPSKRTISPFSKLTLGQYIKARIKDSTEQSLDEAERLAQGDEKNYLQEAAMARNALQQQTNALSVALQQRTNALYLEKLGKLAEAEGLLREWVKGLGIGLAPDDPAVADALAALARNLLSQKKFTDAESPARECLSIREKNTSLLDAWRTFNAKALLGRSLLGQQKYYEAELLLVAAYQGLKEPGLYVPDAARPRVKEAFQALLQLYDASGQPQKAAELRAQKLAETEEDYRIKAEDYRSKAEMGDREALNSLAWLLATCASPKIRDGEGAIAYAERAVAATSNKNDAYLATLAAAYAEAGRFARAVVVQKEAIALTQIAAAKEQYLSRLRLYESGVAYHEEQGSN